MKLNSPLKSFKFSSLLQKFDGYNFGCDYLRLSYKNLTEYIDNLEKKIDFDNSNFLVENIGCVDFTIQKIPTTIGIGLNFTINYNEISVPCFQYVVFDENTHHITGKYGKLDFYGSFFRLIQIGYLPKYILSEIVFTISGEIPKITRYDFRIDFFSKSYVELPKLHDTFGYIHDNSSYIPRHIGKNITDWLLGSKKTGIYAVRFYDKLLDSDKKGKCFLYSDYFEFNSVYRLEFEFQRNFLKGFTFNDFVNGNLLKFIEGILGLNEHKEFYDKLYTTYERDLPLHGIYRSKYIKRYNTMTKRLSSNNINPLKQVYHVLQEEYDQDYIDKLMNDFLNSYFEDQKLSLLKKFTL